jgi:hypothetical protein
MKINARPPKPKPEKPPAPPAATDKETEK